MKFFFLPLFLIISLAHAEDLVPEPGKVLTVTQATTKDKPLLYIPSDYSPDKKWPLVIFFHGVNGEPDLEFIKSVAGNSGFLLYAASYMLPGPLRGYQAVNVEWEHTKALVDDLSKSIPIDKERIYISGFSKGAFLSAVMLIQYHADIAGMWILGGGLQFPPDENLPFQNKEIPIYIGVGEKDPAWSLSWNASQHFSRAFPGTPIFDEITGAGHVYKRTVHGQAWFDVERARSNRETFSARVSEEINQQFDLANNIADTTEKYRALYQLSHSPWYHAASDVDQSAVKMEIASVADNPTVAEQIAASEEYQTIKSQELLELAIIMRATSGSEASEKFKTFQKTFTEKYKDFIAAHPTSDRLTRAQLDIKQLKAMGK